MGIGDWIAIIGIIVMIAIAIWQNTRKVVAYKILSDPAEYKYNTVLYKRRKSACYKDTKYW